MKIFITAIILLTTTSLTVNGQSLTKRALFLGNSYTYANSMPQITVDIASSAGDSLIYVSNTPGGYTLQQHSTNTTSLTMISQGIWDYVILQEQSQRPAFPLGQVQTQVFPYAEILDTTINFYNPCAETMFYMTWGRKNGDALNCASWPPVCTYNGMDSLLRLRYMMMADMNDAVVSPVGAVWRYIRNNHPQIELYAPDESHPSAEGSYAAACSFYTAIFRKDPTLATYNFNISPADAALIRNAAKEVVFDSLSHWFIGTYDLVSDFTYLNTGGGLTYQFTNTSQNVTTQFWDFGFSTDTSSSPMINFPAPGSYNVQLTVYNQCDTNVYAQTVVVTTTGLHDSDDTDFIIQPNPVSDMLTVDPGTMESYDLSIFDLTGHIIHQAQFIGRSRLDVSGFDPGVYIIDLKINNFRRSKKLIIQ